MTAWPRLLLIPIALCILLVEPELSGPFTIRDAAAQLSPNQLPQPGVPAPVDKPDGVAEQAKEGPDQLPTTPVIPQARNKRKRFELFELDGYFRVRTDWFKNFHLGFDNTRGYGVPFVEPLGCRFINDADMVVGPCEDSVKGANMRLRLEPTININETTRVYLQIDVLDNVVLGSTPEALSAGPDTLQLGAFAGNQVPPQGDDNYLWDSVRVRRVWAEVDTSLGQLTFGRQPWHWGLGIYANAGGADPFSGSYDLDSDFGDTVDRVMFRATIPGTNLDAAIATDWALTYPSAAQDSILPGRTSGQPWDVEDNDDVSQWVFMITRFDRPELFTENVARGELGINYGGFVAYRTQDWATGVVDEATTDTLADTLVRRGLKTYTGDAWAKLGLGNLRVEIEGVAAIGSVENVSDIDLPVYPYVRGDNDPPTPPYTDSITESLDIRRFGGVARINYKTVQDKLDLGFELGFASGDQWDKVAPGATHVSESRPLAAGGADTTLQDFRFDFDYKVDLIFFRELLGTVTNATYLKPSGSYLITDTIQAKAQAIFSIANRPVATPGNGSLYGLEFDGDVAYRSGAFTAGIAGGIFLPFAAMDHPADETGNPGSGFGAESQSASTAYTVQTRLSLQF